MIQRFGDVARSAACCCSRTVRRCCAARSRNCWRNSRSAGSSAGM
ncbi:hypothetical protein GIY30_11400 [Gordonia sp. HNM0687]|uniref:Uncharacterized protein n=1 Tax=Gordonia mangrovi TaxID=2665643 RepID=A0A6L7GTF2_9ACTN|nr:hypothetical protein [Gordonia mangrovi]